MRIHSLKIQGFGPFKDQQTIDFDALSEDRIFMLEGPTGAGKSSIIDAIVYGLYGKTAHEAATKDGPSGDRIRSDYCEAGDETKVTLEFTTGGSRYRVTRVAAYDAPKKNGTGTTPINAKATLDFINPVREAITQVREVNMRIKDELGMDHEQFSQMVVLPQGDFASFLHATTEKRREVLESIFKTYFFDKIKDLLDLKSKDVQGKLLQFEASLNHHLQNLKNEWRIDLGEYNFSRLNEIVLDKNLDQKAKSKALSETVAFLRPDGKADLAAQKVLEKDLEPLATSLVNLESAHEKITEKAELEEELAELSDRESEIKEFEAQLKLFSKVAPLQAHLDAVVTAGQDMEDALENIDEEYQDLDAATVKARIKELNTGMPAVAKKAAQAEEASTKVEELEEKLADAQEIEEAIKSLPKLKKEYDRFEAAFKKANEVLKEYRKKQNEGAVAEAAKLLKKGQPCPVCGSKEHPRAAKPGTFDVERLEKLELDRENADFDRSTAKSEYDDAKKLSTKKFRPSVDLKKEIATLSKLANNADEIIEIHEAAQEELKALNDSQEFFIAYEAAERTLTTAQKKIDLDIAKFKITEEELVEILEIDDEEISAELSEFKERVNAIKALLAQDDFKKLPNADILDEQVDKLRSSISEIEGRLKDVNARIALQESTNERIDVAANGILETLKAETELRAGSEATLKLKDWVGGKNTAGLSLTNFVLQERLEMILEYASRHLRRMSNGKYTFKLFEDRQGRNQKAGLGITILDSFAGKERPAETLSGGETFYASLALALGLVEVVKADNGGIELGTLFIDEGFGSLSDDTLEEVLDVLEDLRAERIIGIISHVEGMKTQIPIRLEVRPTTEGPSNVRVAVAGMK